MRERTETERLETERKLSLTRSENESTVTQDKLEKQSALAEQQRLIREDRFRKEADFKEEQQQRDYQAQMKEQELKSALQQLEGAVLKLDLELENSRSEIAERKLDVLARKQEINQTHRPEQLSHDFIEALPRIYGALKIDNYSIMNSGSENGISPIGRVMQEVIGLLQANNLEDLLRRPGSAGSTGGGTGSSGNIGTDDNDATPVEEL